MASPDPNTRREQCPCCGFWTLDELRHWEICSVCFWEDDPHQFDDPDMDYGANGISLREARETYQTIDACSERFAALVRRPHPWEFYPAKD